ncbi:bifunctional [glutamate--ammonia ligase]-adenylyl-L-tyrosine phosphorylase/[glutamate--ammonia-ligase] adenylyltransferase [Marinospirillum sp.]|uniref:bifunctional [glutamate--ammonia ligase]-adenylyl-L-tyrosine phosphorylase/[glutamate--ammonia-ligase] adenylyltransferase n=1 Tax=Marinospirillum sp. TaxID=2183934 RepID=UPI00286FDE4C|nr:bifunctional [glutamate--ammonia ligase]-adenylyl-L-tyrosine phosphorylase/[glutamate--ammonia-ligase] adenylyltransferase [Marinospirillum sp.]MDR9467568.1 bifunctional [glutamate--ammonia ligase]-adenylyl-L-tyrosine phosphorylase/[glutamate--ammonia-ligase] adenylyltransferase [Marinospirillum sp.]
MPQESHPDLNDLPADIRPEVAQSLDRIASSLPAEAWPDLSREEHQALGRLLASSHYAADALVKEPSLLTALLADEHLSRPLQFADYQQECAHYLQDEKGQPPQNEEELHRALRRFRRAAMLRLLWRDAQQAGNHRSVWQTAAEMSWLADTTVEAALGWLEEHYSPAWGRPYPRGTTQTQIDSGEVRPLRLVVLGMGKLGALELNLSSDIDLIFAFAHSGETLGGRRSFDNQEYFTRLGQKLITALDKMTADGYVFRVDMRLRPYGDAGALALGFSALLEYYQDQGRDWERYAMIKARVIAGDQQEGARLLSELRPFVYRKYLDFSAIESLRAMKAMINREVKRRGLDNNIKLGRGGIREVEFITQVFQLIRGGRDTELQERSIRKVLPVIAGLGLMPQQAADELLQDYAFLRDLEHALQGLDDRQTQLLPEGDLAQQQIAFRCGFQSWADLMAQLEQVRDQVRQHFDAVIADPEEEESLETDDDLSSLWTDELDKAQAEKLLAEKGFLQPEASFRLLKTLRDSKQTASMQKVGKERLDNLMPLLLAAVTEAKNPDTALERILWLVEAVLRRTAYLVLLTENPEALQQLVKMCSASPWLAEQLSKMPILLDELLSPDTLYSPADKQRLQDELRQHLSRIPEDDMEALMEALRYFRHANVLRVAASDIVAQRHLMKVSDYLTFIAEVIVESVMHSAWRDLTRRYGRPQLANGEAADPGFIIVGYGKLGGIELGYGSDLDLVFIHDGHPTAGSDGPKSLDSVTYYSRLGQRIIHFLSTVTPSGQLYEVDMRLRPSGNAGLLVSNLKAFADYQSKEAWTWEHQALVRARAICGDEDLIERFNNLRAEILTQKRDLPQLRQDVVTMREKMRANLGSKKQGGDEVFHIKQDAGGIVDIEFIVQYCVLAYSHQHAQLLEVTDNMRLLDALAATGVLPQDQARALQEAYLAYRHAAHHAALEKAGTSVEAAPWAEHRKQVSQVWDAFFADNQKLSQS